MRKVRIVGSPVRAEDVMPAIGERLTDYSLIVSLDIGTKRYLMKNTIPRANPIGNSIIGLV